ncbi:MAG TPA: circadian clock KaiB family protein [Terriglobia bacterium]|nr:circadian clock KaiB family protein [Terriglobia bacterium]
MKRDHTRRRFQTAGPRPTFHLYVSGATARSTDAITKVKPVLEKLYQGNYELRVTDIYQEPQKANAAQVYLAPTLLREHPAPVLRIVGKFSSEDEIRSSLMAGSSDEVRGE